VNPLRFAAFVPTFLFAFVFDAEAGEWTRFRGPNGAGHAAEANIPTKWSDEDIAWKTKLPAPGNSSPVVWGETVYVTSGDGESGTYTVVAIDVTNGEIRWTKAYDFAPHRVNNLNGYASSTPAVDEHGVYVMWFGDSESHVAALSHDGEERWKHGYGEIMSLHGPSPSPIVHDGKLIFALEQEGRRAPTEGGWYALDSKTGETVWMLERETSLKASSNVPCVYTTADGNDWLVFSSFAHGITVVDANDGTVVCEESDAIIARTVGSPVVAGDFVVASCGQRGGGLRMVAYDLSGGEGAPLSLAHQIEERYVPYVPTPVSDQGLLYTFQDAGTVTCVELKTGNVLWSERVRAKFFGSPVLVGGKLYCIAENGQVIVLKAGPAFEHLATNELGEGSHSTPAVAGGRMFLRTQTQLICVAGNE
jgi:outer membrane protein assembly factor BamB